MVLFFISLGFKIYPFLYNKNLILYNKNLILHPSQCLHNAFFKPRGERTIPFLKYGDYHIEDDGILSFTCRSSLLTNFIQDNSTFFQNKFVVFCISVLVQSTPSWKNFDKGDGDILNHDI